LACSHSIAISGDGCPDDVRLSDIEPRFICRACGKRGADVRPDFHWNAKPVGALICNMRTFPAEKAIKRDEIAARQFARADAALYGQASAIRRERDVSENEDLACPRAAKITLRDMLQTKAPDDAEAFNLFGRRSVCRRTGNPA
jgi:hypothetical protein